MLKYIIIIMIVVVILYCIRIVPQAHAFVIEFLGSYKCTWGNGLHFLIPGLERVAKRVSLKEQVLDFDPQPVITKDNVTMQIDTVVYYKISDPKLFVYGVEHPLLALENLTATTLRNIIGEMELDETLTSRDRINEKMRGSIDEASVPWGIKVTRIELKNIIPPDEIRTAMEKQMKAEREKRQTLTEADAHKQAIVARAEGDKQAMILAAEAERDAKIAKAKGEAESIRLVYEAEAAGLANLQKVVKTDGVIELKKLEALKELGNGNATKLIVPAEIASVASVLSSAAEIVSDKGYEKKKPEQVEKPDDPCCNAEDTAFVKRKEFISRRYRRDEQND